MQPLLSAPVFSFGRDVAHKACHLPCFESAKVGDLPGRSNIYCVTTTSSLVGGVSVRSNGTSSRQHGAWHNNLGVQQSTCGFKSLNKRFLQVQPAQRGGGPCCLCASGAPGSAVLRGRTQQALQSRDRRPKKWLGQHYMVDDPVNAKIVETANIQAGDVVLEIGPGTGALTDVLTRAGARVIVVEKDPDMAALIEQRFQDTDQVEVVLKDVLKWPIRKHMTQVLKQHGGSCDTPKQAKVVSNLPFNITSDVVKAVLPMGDLFSHVVLLLQDEAAVRLVKAVPKSSEYRSMSLFVNFYSEPDYRFQVKRTSFFPSPNVDAALVHFRVKQAAEYPAVTSPRAFFTLVNSAFQNKRKMLRTSLQHLYSSAQVQEALGSVGLAPTARPEELSLQEFVAFFNACCELGERDQGSTTGAPV